ncbi:MAG: response regulator [Candidatus Polarisedimenticolaceae bacterium]|nr:response regulator [Candidatus Polarisedimenticolaceae bacterium]
MERTLLLVDDEPNILQSLKRLLRRGGYRILTAESGREGLELLENNTVQVIVSDARMPGMSGIEFLDKSRERWPDCIRIMLSGYTELESVIQAVNRSAIYKFFTKPWEDALLQDHIEEAFRQYELQDENNRLTQELHAANDELARINQGLEECVDKNVKQSELSLVSLKIAQDVLEHLPIGVIGISVDNLISSANQYALRLLNDEKNGLVGLMANDALPPEILQIQGAPWQNIQSINKVVLSDGRVVEVQRYQMENDSGVYANMLLIQQREEVS